MRGANTHRGQGPEHVAAVPFTLALLGRVRGVQLLVVEDVEQIMDQAVTRQCLVHYAGKQSLPMLQLPPWGLQQGVTQTIDSWI